MTTRFFIAELAQDETQPVGERQAHAARSARGRFFALAGRDPGLGRHVPRPGLLGRSQALEGRVRGVDEQIWEVVARVAKKNGLAVEPVVITGTASPNEALNNGDLEANSFSTFPS